MLCVSLGHNYSMFIHFCVFLALASYDYFTYGFLLNWYRIDLKLDKQNDTLKASYVALCHDAGLWRQFIYHLH